MTTEAAAARAKLLRQELARFIEIVTRQMQPERIILFGSCATGHIGEWSDLDLVVIAPTDLPFYLQRSQTTVEKRVAKIEVTVREIQKELKQQGPLPTLGNPAQQLALFR